MASTKEKIPLYKRLIPRTIFGQLLLVFTSGLIVLQLIGIGHFTASREYYLLRSLVGDRARLMADMVMLLDSVETAAGQDIFLKKMEEKGFHILILPSKPDIQTGGNPPDQIFHSFLVQAVQFARLTIAPEDILVKVDNILLSSMMDEMQNSIAKFMGKPITNHNSYHAYVAMPLSSGEWVVIVDSSKNFPLIPAFPFFWGIVGIIACALLSLFAVYRIVRPLRTLSKALESFGHDMAGAPPMPEKGPRELQEVAHTFNLMQTRIREDVDEKSRTLAAVSHDIRTPLTRLGLRLGSLDNLEESTSVALQRDMDEITTLLDTAIDLARATSPENMALVDIVALLESIQDDRQDMGQDVELIDDPDLLDVKPLKALPLCLKRCIDNLVDNAVRYGNCARMAVVDSQFTLTIFIMDAGPGIPENMQAKVFEPFFRLEPSRCKSTGGTGLGLSIARSMARALRAEIRLLNMPEGGLCASVTFFREQV